LTTVRDVEPLTATLSAMSGTASATLREMLVASRRDARPSLADLAAAFTGITPPAPAAPKADVTGVVDWIEWKRTAPDPKPEPAGRATATASGPISRGSAPTPRQHDPAGYMALVWAVCLFILAAMVFGVYAIVNWLL
jgi:hypothetical protein